MINDQLECEKPVGFERPRYFLGRLLEVQDCQQEQLYHRSKHATHLRSLHGHGTVCGLAVRSTTPPSRRIIVEPGLAVDCCGREIVVESDQVIDVPDELSDRSEQDLYVVARYVESPGDVVPVILDPDSEATVEARSIEERFELELRGPRGLDLDPRRLRLDPDEVRRTGFERVWEALVSEVVRPCEPCVDTRLPLARITVRPGEAVTSNAVDNTIRPIVLSADLLTALMAEVLRITQTGPPR